ncbi:transcriptional regulator [Isoptericola jiangsuensis]|uniref:Transcriptional regulator n=1 Tax=Isoptericola jiangsuensis TaxID=548579 RepID=A0A2A9EU15_9MICO|nr:LuxR family transcriptional regulator [Isoptericola jiangsuensis]PFG42066.1 transcriptional regulator [Isoptericola jiangsuensis]
MIHGRDAELARVDRLAAPGASGALLVVGDPGLGKTTLLDHAAERARRAGRAVLTACGDPAERDLAFAALHQLLLPRLDHLDRLPGPQRRALGAALGLTEATAVPDRLHLAAGALTLLGEPGDDGSHGAPGDDDGPGTLVVVDDLHWFDDASRDVVLFCARRLPDVPGGPGLLVATRPPAPDTTLPHVVLSPLDDDAAARVLDEARAGLDAAARRRVLGRAGGNPLALVELPDIVTDGPEASSDRLDRLWADRLADLPGVTRRVLLLAAVADSDDLAVVVTAAGRATDPGAAATGAPDGPAPGPWDDATLAAWAPAEAAGLVHLDDGRVRFRHPLVRTAVRDVAPLAERRGAHLALAEASTDPDRRAWHLAAAAVGPDADAAQALEDTAERARLRGGWAAAARALERAGELSPDPADATRRLLLAAPAAMFTGRTDWVERVAARARSLAPDAASRHEADLFSGWALAQTARHEDAVRRLTALARATRDDDPDLAVAALAPAAVAAYNGGEEHLLDEVGAALAVVAPEDDDPVDAWVRGAVAPFAAASRAALDRAVATHADLGIRELDVLGGAAWVLDETRLAERLLARLVDLFADGPTAGTNALVSSTLAATRLELGRWDAAQACADDATRLAQETGMPLVELTATLTTAHVAVLRGQVGTARALARRVLAAVDPDVTRTVGVRARLVLGLAELVDGRPEAAHDVLRRGFTTAGGPVHRHASVHLLVPLAEAAVAAGRTADARGVLAAVAEHVGSEPGPRVAALLHQAHGLLAGDDPVDGGAAVDGGSGGAPTAEQHLRAALADPAAATWPFERALVRLHLGERLRRDRRVSEARTELSAALETFVRLGARPFVERATAELRAAGVRVADRTADPLADLTAQQQRIVRLAAQGRTNREIAEQLFLSPRTVGFHLYRVFPLLGVTSRAQLRDVVDPA